MDKRTKVLFVFFMVTLVVMGGALYSSHDQARPVADPNGETSIVEPAICAEGKQVALFGGYVTATIYTDLVKTSSGNLYEQSIFVRVYTKESFNARIETLGGGLLEEFTIKGNDGGYNIVSVHCVSPDPAVIITAEHGSKVERARLLSDVICNR